MIEIGIQPNCSEFAFAFGGWVGSVSTECGDEVLCVIKDIIDSEGNCMEGYDSFDEFLEDYEIRFYESIGGGGDVDWFARAFYVALKAEFENKELPKDLNELWNLPHDAPAVRINYGPHN